MNKRFDERPLNSIDPKSTPPAEPTPAPFEPPKLVPKLTRRGRIDRVTSTAVGPFGVP